MNNVWYFCIIILLVNNINLGVNMASGKPIIAVEKCKGCGLCIRACPKNLLEMSKDTNGQGVHYPVCNDESKCIACTFCATMCPDVVIEIEKDA